MHLSLSLNEFLALAQGAERVAIHHEIMADHITPITLFSALYDEMQGGAMLESGLSDETAGRYSHLAFDPIAECHDLHMPLLTSACKQEIAAKVGHVFGVMSYDAVRSFENIPDRHAANKSGLPDILLRTYRTSLVFDHHQQTLLISTIVEMDAEPAQIYAKAQEKIAALVAKIMIPPTGNIIPVARVSKANPGTKADIGDEEFMQLVLRAKEYIAKGDAFQIVLSRSFQQAYTANPFDIYRALRQVSPAPYMFYLQLHDRVLIGASPERMLSVNQGEVTINPIAGTRKRTTEIADEIIASELLQDEKERAEHTMLVDLARNDIGAVCLAGSVTVKNFMQVKHYSHVSHLVSEVTGRLQKEVSALSALTKAFPAGTLSGAPKIRAMEIIDELETSRRGFYGGAVLRLDLAGNLDSCIAIRIAELKDGVATVRAGAGIVYASDPQKEAEETRQKAKTVLDAITLAEGGLQ